MSKIKYEFYSEKDASAVAELMKKNKFWIGKFDQNLTGEKFIDYQRKKGTIFGIVGRKNDKVVSYVAAYKTGGQKVANKNQAFICALIIAQKYRLSVFSISDMFSMLIKELIRMGYNDLICEVAKDNYPSFYMMRKCGFVIIDENPTLYGDYVLHNYFPGVIKMLNQIDYADSNAIPEVMQKLDKKNLYHSEQMIDHRFINMECKTKKQNYSFYVDTLSGNIAGVHLHDAKFKIWPNNNKLNSYLFENFGNDTRKVNVAFWEDNHVITSETYETDFFHVDIPENVTKITFDVNNDADTYTFFVKEMIQYGLYQFEQKNINFTAFSFEENSGFLSSEQNSNHISLFKEMWPHLCAPYIEGIFIPNYEKNLTVDQLDNKKITVTEHTDDYILIREYKSIGNKIEIHTKAKMLSQMQVQPMFQFALYDLSYNCEITLNDKTIVNRKYDPGDGDCVTEEMIFLNFLLQEYSNKYFKQIDLRFTSVPNVTFRIKSEKLATCFCQLNYLGIEYNKKIFKGKNEIDFGIISIEKIHCSGD